MLKPEINSHDVRNNLLMHEQLGSYLYYFANNEERKRGTIDFTVWAIWFHHQRSRSGLFYLCTQFFIKIPRLIWQ